MDKQKNNFRRYKDDDDSHLPWNEEIFEQDTSYKCPTYIHRTPPCQGLLEAPVGTRSILCMADELGITDYPVSY